MIRKLKSGKYRLYSRKKNPRTLPPPLLPLNPQKEHGGE